MGCKARGKRAPMADLIIINADVVTLNRQYPKASAVAVRDGKIIAVGDRTAVMGLRQSHTQILDAEGKTLCPGFIDPHLHFRALAESLVDMDLSHESGITDIAGIQRLIRGKALKTKPGKWLRAVGYHEFCLKEKRHPDRLDLDPASPDHPVKLTHRSGYAHILNSAGLKLAGISRQTPDPEGAVIERDLNTGEPTGVLFGMGKYLNDKIPPVDDEDLLQGVELADRQLISFGVTSFQDASSRNDADRVKWFQHLKQKGVLTPLVSVMMGFEAFQKSHEAGFRNGNTNPDVGISGVKIVVDETTGRLNPDPKMLNEMVRFIHRSGKQAVIHAIEDRAVDAAVTAIALALTRFPRPDHRHRIEHCSICPPALIHRIAAAKIHVVTHPAFVYCNGDRYLAAVSPEQMPFLYPVASLLKAGVAVAAASDAPIVSPDPLSAVYGAVARLTLDGKILLENEKILPEMAIRMVTESAARANFEENVKGSISIGKAADFVVLSANPLKVSPEEIRNITVEKTIIGGKVALTNEWPEMI
jgi:predicted amidohydrolase YtcJ